MRKNMYSMIYKKIRKNVLVKAAACLMAGTLFLSACPFPTDAAPDASMAVHTEAELSKEAPNFGMGQATGGRAEAGVSGEDPGTGKNQTAGGRAEAELPGEGADTGKGQPAGGQTDAGLPGEGSDTGKGQPAGGQTDAGLPGEGSDTGKGQPAGGQTDAGLPGEGSDTGKDWPAGERAETELPGEGPGIGKNQPAGNQEGAYQEDKDPSAEAATDEGAASVPGEIVKEPRRVGEKTVKDPRNVGESVIPDEVSGDLLSVDSLSEVTRNLLMSGLKDIPALQEPVTAGGMTIEKIQIRWLTRSTGSDTAAGFDRLELAPEGDNVSAQQWQIDFALSGKHEHEAGSIEIVMPAHIWLDRDGSEPGILTIAVPEDPDTGADFAWKRIGDSIVITNIRNISAAAKLMIQGSFRQMKAHEMVDSDVAEGSVYETAQCRGISDELFAVINLTVPGGEVISMISNTVDASISTSVVAASASITAYNAAGRDYYVYWDIPSDIPTDFLPENPGDYVYVRWFVTGQARGNQPYTMTVTDSANGEFGCRVLGVTGADGKNIKSEDNETVTAVLFSGYNTQMKSAYIWTAYEKSYFTEETRRYTVHNTQTVTVTGMDDLVATARQAGSEVSWTVPVSYTVTKEWDDNDDERGLRPGSQLVRIYRNRDGHGTRQLWRTVSLTEDSDWSYTWSDEGRAWHYETQEINFARGSFETWYDEDGKYHKANWAYTQKSAAYDPDTRTWDYVNTLVCEEETGGIEDLAEMKKSVLQQFDDPDRRSTRDRALKCLLHGKDAIIPYKVRGRAVNPDVRPVPGEEGNVPERRLNVILEESQHTNMSSPVRDPIMMNNRRAVSGTDYEIAYADVDMPGIYGFTGAAGDSGTDEADYSEENAGRYILEKCDDACADAVFEGLIDGQWVILGELRGGAFVGTNGGRFTGTKLILPRGVTQFREIVSSPGALTELSYTVGIRLRPSPAVLDQIRTAAAVSDYMMMTVDNFARMYMTDEGTEGEYVTEENPLGQNAGQELSAWDRAYLHGRVYRVAAYQTKEFKMTENDTSRKRMVLHTRATTVQQSNILTGAEYRKAAADGDIPFTAGGIWYDLLPPGVEPVTDSVKMQEGDRILDTFTVSNYRNSGRTLLVVRAKLADHVTFTDSNSADQFSADPDYPEEGYKQTQIIEFDSFYSWQDAGMYGLEGVRNSIAFGSDDKWVGNLSGWSGETDDPRSGGNKWTEESVRSDLDIMTDLTPEKNDSPSFLYAGAQLVYEDPDFMAEASIRKWVSAEGSGIWSYGHNGEAVVCEGGKYRYRIDITGDSETETKDIIILDSLENYIPTADKPDHGDHQWRGHFCSLDTGRLVDAGIEPVVYYSTVPDLDISKDNGYNQEDGKGVIADILQNAVTQTGERVWTTVLPEDPSAVTAYAIDCRKKADGSDYMLSEGETLSVYVHMKAPQEEEAQSIWCAGTGQEANPDPACRDETNPDDNAHAYNNVYLDSTQVDGIGRETHAYIHWDYVRVGIIPYSIAVEKEWDDMNDNDGIRPESVAVHLLGNGTDTGRTIQLSSDTHWKGEFTHTLRYDDEGNWITYSFEEEPAEGYEMSYSRKGDKVYLSNKHEPEKISVPFEKRWTGDTEETRPSSVTVKLYADGIYTGMKMTVTQAEDGTWAGVFKGQYKYRDGHEVEYSVVEEAVDDYEASYEKDGETRVITNTYHPMGDLIIEKHLENATSKAGETDFTFTLVLTGEDGSPLTETYRYTASDGRTGFLKSGDSFTLRGGQTLTVRDIPTHTSYEVTEEAAKGFTNTVRTGGTGTILSYKESLASFTNTYSSHGALYLSARKILNGQELTRYRFRFRVDGMQNGGTDPGMMRMASNAADGSVSFGAVRYTEKDDGREQVFRITEVDQGNEGYTYDDHAVYVRVIPRDCGDGTMTCTPVYYDSDWNEIDGTEIIRFADGYVLPAEEWENMTGEQRLAAEKEHANEDDGSTGITEEKSLPATFINEYRANGEAVLRAWKQLCGRSLADGEFEFELLDAKGSVIRTARNLADGSIVFDPILFTEKHIGRTAAFFVREKAGDDGTVLYDESVYGFDVTVMDGGDGTLRFRQGHQNVESVEEDGVTVYRTSGKTDSVPVFMNRLKDGALSVSKFTTWQEGGTPDPDQEFRFKVRLIGPDGTPLEDGVLEYEPEQIGNR